MVVLGLTSDFQVEVKWLDEAKKPEPARFAIDEKWLRKIIREELRRHQQGISQRLQ